MSELNAMNNTTLAELLDFFWNDYSQITPDALAIHNLLRQRGETVVNDHIAFRTFDRDPIGIESLGATCTALGYRVSGNYLFEAKKLRALSYAHPDGGYPHIFISELLTDQCSAELQRIVAGLVEQVDPSRCNSPSLYTDLPTWVPVPFEDYQTLLAESEYAGWLAAFGIRANHFTVLINALKTFESLQEFNGWLRENGFVMNESGGEIKGSPELLLEQSSIMARRIAWEFAGGEHHNIPSCYHEFARRYTDPATGRLYEGFVARSADKIFESTDSGIVT